MIPGDWDIILGWQCLASLNPFVLSCTMLSKFYCLTFRTEFGAWRSRNRTAGPEGTWTGTMGLCLWMVGLSSGGPVPLLPASWTSFRGNFEFPLFEYGKLDQLLFWSKICYKTVRRLLYYRAVYFLWQDEDFLSSVKSGLLRNLFSGEKVSTLAPGTPSYKSDRVFFWVLHSLEICLYAIQAFSMLWSPIWG